MSEAPLDPSEQERLAALRELELLDTGREIVFDRIVALAQRALDVPIALISLVDAHRQWFKAGVGVDVSETPRSQAICAHAILSDDVLVIPDAARDPRTADNPLVTGPMGLRFYAGAPLIDRNGLRLGTVCAIDRRPRRIGDTEIAQLRDLAGVTMDLIRHRDAARLIEAERGRAEESERRLRVAIDALPDGFALYDRDDRLVMYNQTYIRLYGRSADAVRIGATFEELIRYGAEHGQYPEAHRHPDGVEGWIAERLRRHRNPSDPIEQKVDGSRWLRVHETKTRRGEIVGFRVDISWQKRVSETLRLLQRTGSNDQLSFRDKVDELVRFGREILNADVGLSLEVDEASMTVTAVSARDGLLPGLETGETLPVGANGFAEALSSGQPVVWSNGSHRPHATATDAESRLGARALLAAPVILDGRIVALLGFASLRSSEAFADPPDPHKDLIGIMVDWLGVEIRRRRALRALRDAKEEAEQNSRAKTRFLAMMSHELRTPMNGVLGLLDLLAGTELETDQREMLALARQSADNLLAILNDILDFSKLEAGRLDLETVSFDLPSLVSEVVRLLAPQAEARGLRLFTVIDTGVPMRRRGDPTRLRQLLINLVGNAIKFTRHGAVTIDIGPNGPDPIGHGGDGLLVRVRDTGIGIPEERRDALFEEFSQLDSSVARQFGGTGLGLAICKRLAEMMGGSIRLDGTGPDGSCFAFEVSVRPDAKHAGTVDVSGIAGRRVLIIDGSPEARAALRRQIGIWGAVVRTAETIETASRSLDAFRPDTVVLRVPAEPDGSLGIEMELASLAEKVGDPGLRVVLLRSRHTVGLRLGTRPRVIDDPVDPMALMVALDGRRPDPDGAGDEAAAARPEPVSGDRSLEVLVAEDNAVNQVLMTRALERMGHRPTVVGDGLAAYAAAKTRHFDLILMDIEMPEMDGIEAVRWIRERLQDETPPIIAMTAHVMPGSRDWLISSGFTDYLSKPLKLDLLRRMLAERAVAAAPPAPAPVRTEQIASADAPSAETPVLDEERLGELVEMLPAEVFADMAAQFLDAADGYVATLRGQFAEDDIDAVGRTAHAIKGLALNFGAPGLAGIAAGLERSARESPADLDVDSVERLDGLAAATRRELQDRISAG